LADKKRRERGRLALLDRHTEKRKVHSLGEKNHLYRKKGAPPSHDGGDRRHTYFY